MMRPTKRKDSTRNFFARLWNEFLFARDFEYETPLTPDEMAASLQQLDGVPYKTWVLAWNNLVHKVDYERDGDKAGYFKIELESVDRDKWWTNNSAMVYAEGQLTADPESGMTIITGRTRFDGSYYSTILFMFSINLITQLLQQAILWQTMWFVLILVFWYGMYRSRNQLSDRLDHIIMTAKSDAATSRLKDEDTPDATASLDEHTTEAHHAN